MVAIAYEQADPGDEKKDDAHEEQQLKRSGCVILPTDTGNVIGSIALFACFIVYGACQGGLGAALPALAQKFGVSEGKFGIAFTTRGIGYLCGTVASAFISEMPFFPIPKEVLVCIAVVITGLATGLIAGIDNYEAVLFFFFVQGCGFGGIDTFANVVLPEFWGTRVQPWMQALHSCFGIGAVIGPALVGGFGYYVAFIILAIISAVPLIAMAIEALMRDRRGNGDVDEQKGQETTDQKFQALPTDAVKEDPEAPRSVVSVLEQPPVEAAVAAVAAAEAEAVQPADASSSVVRSRKVPLLSRGLITLFFFIYVGAECGYGGWVSTFALTSGVTASQGDAAFVASIFWAALTAGRVIAIPQALYLSTTAMLRLQLFLSVVGAILTCTINPLGFPQLCVASAVLGYALSSIFPLAMTLAMDYGLVMDGPTTSAFVIGSTFGEGIIPVVIGIAMTAGGPMVLSLCVVTSIGLLLLLYGIVHLLLLKEKQRLKEEGEEETPKVSVVESSKL